MLRTAVSGSSTNVCEIQIGANQIGYGMVINASNATITPAVWVRTGVITHDVTVRYVDANGAISPPSTHSVEHGSTFTLSSAPSFPSYNYLHWKEGASGSPNTGAIQLTDVTQNKEIYLVYEKEIRADVTITKTVAGDYADRTKTYEFTLTFRDSGNTLLPTNTQFTYTGGVIADSGATAPSGGTLTLTNGVGTIHLQHGQTVTIKNVLSTDQIQIAETPQGGYAPSYKDSADLSGTSISSDDTGPKTVGTMARSFDFTNTRVVPPPMGIWEDSRAFAALLSISVLLLLSGAAVTILKRKRVWARAG